MAGLMAPNVPRPAAPQPVGLPAAPRPLLPSPMQPSPQLYKSRDGTQDVDFLGRPIKSAAPAAAATPTPAAPAVVNTAAKDPGLTALSNMVSGRLNYLQSTESQPNTVDYGRLKQQAQGDISQQTAGRLAALKENMAATGGATGPAQAALEEQIRGEAGRTIASTDAGIDLQGQQAQDARNDARRSETTNAMLGSLPVMSANPNLALAQQGLGLQQMSTQASIDNAKREADARDRDQQLSTLLALNNLYGNPLAGASSASLTGW